MTSRLERMLANAGCVWLFTVASWLAVCAPAWAHHQIVRKGPVVGIAIPAIAHGEMLVIAKYRATILDQATHHLQTDPIFLRLAGFVSLQYFACVWGLVPGSLTDEGSPFNECSHAYLAGARALLAHMAEMSDGQSAAKALQERINTELSSDPAFGAICSNSAETFDSGVIVWPDWGIAFTHSPTVLMLSGLSALAVIGLWSLHFIFNLKRRATRASNLIPF
ncbi:MULTISPECIES: hypothetical protein [Bradyrhizobium]|uniref:Transmembrane protein n=3 Tax=Bradyrhizobium TaxID=374 RepID=A0A973WVZ7_9BRAD|nr:MULTISPECIES: hypothetical protein [Bradyrhizobium]UFX49391.1 hypothetical protein HAP47_0040635 [Bradyrhizobium sp. 41S5]UGA49117.1 hypothetical protein HU230_0043265 [Bradyrhizobium quebecense]UGY07469.1 hypothetical protein J4P68_0040585 [Bradyrhizobium quebecense]UGY11975.1 hypothetical protein HAP48_0000610 [Bradyrhizobium septentrionale]UGY30178.1 hypothetical protein HU675_0048005 [Bradyrhizobium septentrionale]